MKTRTGGVPSADRPDLLREQKDWIDAVGCDVQVIVCQTDVATEQKARPLLQFAVAPGGIMRTAYRPSIGLALVSLVCLAGPTRALAHCDALDGPVVTAARKALETRNPALVLIWVTKEGEAETQAAFERTLLVRTLSPTAKELADRYFFETVVRIHRAGEGEPYNGLKPAGQDLPPAIAAADQALAHASADALVRLLGTTIEAGVRARLNAVVWAGRFNRQDLEAGREYVKAYVDFLHYVEGVYLAAAEAGHDGHTPVRP